YLVLAECYLQTGQDPEVVSLLQPRESMFGGDLAYAYVLGSALLHVGNTADGQRYVDRVFGAGEAAEGHLLMGMAYLGQQGYQSAKPELAKAVDMNPRLPTAHAMYGRSLLGLGGQAAAQEAVRRERDLAIHDVDENPPL